MTDPRPNPLRAGVRFCLFATAYTPLFLLIIVNQLFEQPPPIFFPNISVVGFLRMAMAYPVSLVLLVLIIVGFVGLALSLHFQSQFTEGGYVIRVKEVKNKNSETMSYIGTYIVPFLFEDVSSPKAMISLFILLLLIYFVYTNSAAILINPILNIRYSLYEVVFTGRQKRPDGSLVEKTGMLITKRRHLQEEDALKIDRIGNQLYFGVEYEPRKEGRPGTVGSGTSDPGSRRSALSDHEDLGPGD